MTIKEIFDAMSYGPAPESNAEAKAWLAKHAATFGHFIDGKFTAPAAGFATPSTYQAHGKQYVVIACGGTKLGTS